MDTAVAFCIRLECTVREWTCMEFDFLRSRGVLMLCGCSGYGYSALMTYLDMDCEALFRIECSFTMGTNTIIESLTIFHVVMHGTLDAFNDAAC